MDRSAMQLVESVLGGGGEMGERMRAVDWSTTALGPLEQWPQSLRICVQIILGSGYPMAIGWGPDYTLLYNDAQRVLFGTKHPAALGRGTREVFPEAWESVGPLYDRVMRQGQAYTTLADQLFPLNRYNYLEECYFALSYSPIPDDSGHVGGVFVTGIDTTERVIEDRRRQVLRDVASRTAEARYEDDVWRVSADTLGEHRLTIPFAFLYVYRPSDRKAYLVGRSVEPDALDPSVIDCTRQNLWGFDTTLPGEGIVVELGQRASVLPSTSWPLPPEKAAVVPIRLREESSAAGFLVLGIHPGRAFDDTYRQFVHRIAEQIAIGLASARAYEQERQRADALAEIDRSKTAFFSNVSHEFRTPLQLMLGPLEEVLQGARERLGPESHQQLLTVRRNALRLLKLVNTLLDFSRVEARRVEASYQPTDLAALTSDIASVFRSAMDSAGLQFSVECQPIAEPVFVDRGMWERIVLNLLSNAFKFTFEGEVAISLKPVDGAVELQVRDTGVGIPDDQREKVFDRFHRIEHPSARTHEGTGIGLALVQELVKLHGGSVAVKSAVGVGSTFTVTIPRGKEHLRAESIHAEQSVASSDIRAEAYVEEALRWVPDASSAPVEVPMLSKLSPLSSSREAVLGSERELIVLADDNADMREYLTRLLGDRYEVHAVADGHQALEVARQLRPALVLADVMMPQLDGFGLLRAIREDSVLCSTPVILVSARAGEESRVEGLQADADDYLVKPFTSPELLARVATHMKMAHLRRVTAEREERLRNEAELQRQKLLASQELLAQTSRLYRDLGERERESRMIVNSIPGLVATLTPTGEVEDVTEQVIAYCGQTLEELKRWGTSDTVHPDDLPRVIETISSSIKSGEPYEIVHRMRRFDGVYRWFQVRGLPLRDSEGRTVRWYVLLTDIDDLKRAEKALHESERESRLIVDRIPGIVGTYSPSGEIEILNQRMLEYFGRSLEEMRHWGEDDTFHPEDRSRAIQLFTHALASQEPLEYEARLRRFDGVYRWFQVRAFPARDSTGRVARWYTLVTDIDDRKRAEDALRVSERGLRLIVDTIPALVWCATAEGDLDYLNQRAVEYLGHTVQSLTGGRWLDLVHPDHRDATSQRWLQSARTGSSYEDVYRLRRADGEYRWIQSVGEPFHDADGRIANWYGLVIDIEDRKRAETELRQAYDSFADAQHLSHTGSFVTDLVGDDHNWSEETYHIFEFEPGSKVTLQRIAAIIHPDDRPSFESMIAQAMSGDNVDFSFRIVTTQAAVKYVRGVAHVVEKIEGRPMFVGALQDVTESRVAEQDLDRARSELAHVARVTAVSALTASIAHEVNQPLSGIITNAGTCLRMLAAEPPDVEGARETARRTLRDGNRAADVITRLRALFSKREFTLELLDMNDVAREVVALSLGDLQRKRVALQTEFAADLPPITGDRIQLQQVILNLLRNGSDAMATVNERPRRLLIRTERDADKQVRVTIRDAGVGLDAQSMDKLFDAFFTTKTEGMGIGLSVSRSIIERHHGRLWAEPNEGPGATFSFAIPAAPEPAGAIDTKV